MDKDEVLQLVNEEMGFLRNVLDMMLASPAPAKVYVEGAPR